MLMCLPSLQPASSPRPFDAVQARHTTLLQAMAPVFPLEGMLPALQVALRMMAQDPAAVRPP